MITSREREEIVREAVRRARIGQTSGTGSGGSGEANTGASLGAGADVFKEKSGVELRFRSLTGSGNVTLTEGASEIDVNVVVLVPVASGGELLFDGSGDVILTPYVP